MIVVFVLTWTLNAICASILFVSMLPPWRMLPLLGSCVSGRFKRVRRAVDSYSYVELRMASVFCLCQSIFDLFTLPFFCLGLCTIVRAPLSFGALIMRTPEEEDKEEGGIAALLNYSFTRRFMIINHGINSLANVLVFPLAIVAVIVPTCTWEVVRGSCHLAKYWWNGDFGDTPKDNDGRFLDSLVIFYVWRFLHACGDCAILLFGVLFALLVPTRAWVFFGRYSWLWKDT